MIVLKKIAFLRPLLLHASMLMRFSEEAKREQLSVSAQKAVWAASIIETISKASLPSSIRDPSLRDVILNLSDPSTEFEFQDASKNDVMKLFKDGVQLAKPFIVQSKISDAQQSNDLPSSQPTSPTQTLKKFIFFPNRTVTTPMFKQLMNQHRMPYIQRRNILMTGGSGTSKTVSIILFIQLFNYQTRFVFETLGDEEKKKEYDKIISLGLMPDQTVKYWYWSAELQSNDKRIIELITEQAVELQQSEKAKLLQQISLNEFTTKLRNHYNRKHFVHRVIVDQMNFIAAMMREQNKKRQPSHTSQAAKLCEFFRLVIRLGENYILNSSVAIQNQLLKKNYSGLSLKLIDFDRSLSNLHFPYENKLESSGGKIDFWQTFWFEFQRSIKSRGLDLTSIQTAKTNFYQNVQGLSISTLCRFYYARTFLSTHFSRFYESVMSQGKENVQNEIRLFQAHCLEQSKISLDDIVVKKIKDEKTKVIILKNSYQIARIILNYSNYDKPLIIPMDHLEKKVKEKLNDYKFSLAQFFFEYEIKEITISQLNNRIKFQSTIGQFVRYGEKMFDAKEEESTLDFLNILQMKSYQIYLVREQYMIFYLRKCLIKNGTLGYSAYDMSNKRISEHFSIYQATAFIPGNSKSKKATKRKLKTHEGVTIQQNFGCAIETAKSNPGKDIFAQPFLIINKREQMNFGWKSAVIDFLIVKYQSEQEKFHIWSFDVTIAEEVDTKIKDVKRLYEKLLKDTQIKDSDVVLKHVIVCSQFSQIPNMKTESKTNSTNQADLANQEDQTDTKGTFPCILYVYLQGLDVTSQSSRRKSQFVQLVDYNAVLASHFKQEKILKQAKKKQQMKILADKLRAKQSGTSKAEQEAKSKVEQKVEQKGNQENERND